MIHDGHGRFFLIDSHSRNSQGLIDPDGSAVLMEFTGVGNLGNYLVALYRNRLFTITPVTISCESFSMHMNPENDSIKSSTVFESRNETTRKSGNESSNSLMRENTSGSEASSDMSTCITKEDVLVNTNCSDCQTVHTCNTTNSESNNVKIMHEALLSLYFLVSCSIYQSDESQLQHLEQAFMLGNECYKRMMNSHFNNVPSLVVVDDLPQTVELLDNSYKITYYSHMIYGEVGANNIDGTSSGLLEGIILALRVSPHMLFSSLNKTLAIIISENIKVIECKNDTTLEVSIFTSVGNVSNHLTELFPNRMFDIIPIIIEHSETIDNSTERNIEHKNVMESDDHLINEIQYPHVVHIDKLQGHDFEYEKQIRMTANNFCKICDKILFPNQTRELEGNTVLQNIGITNSSICVCSMCFNSVSKNIIPASAVVNHLNAGEIPTCISDLTIMSC